MFGFRARRRRRIMAEPFPAAWQATLHRSVGLYGLLEAGERSTLRDRLRIFIAERSWEAAQAEGFALTDEMRVIVAANACILTLAMDGEPLRHVRAVIIQPGVYVPPQPRIGAGGIVQEGGAATGTAYTSGVVVLSWAHVVAHSRDPHDGRNVVLHEFAHQLDMTGGVVNGTPPLPSRDLRSAWNRVMTEAFAQLGAAVEHGLPTVIDPYGATSPGEFFAVATECFFERPIAMRDAHPGVYRLLRAYYRQDTARRAEGAPGRA